MSTLNEANRYFFGTENPKDVKRLFENNDGQFRSISKLSPFGEIMAKTGDKIIIAEYYASRINAKNITGSKAVNFDLAVMEEINRIRKESLIDISDDLNGYLDIRSYVTSLYDFSEIMYLYLKNKLKVRRMSVEKSHIDDLRLNQEALSDFFSIDRETEDFYIIDGVKPVVKYLYTTNQKFYWLVWDYVVGWG